MVCSHNVNPVENKDKKIDPENRQNKRADYLKNDDKVKTSQNDNWKKLNEYVKKGRETDGTFGLYHNTRRKIQQVVVGNILLSSTLDIL